MSITTFLHKFPSVYNNSTIYTNMEKWAPTNNESISTDKRNVLWVFQVDDVNPDVSEISKNLETQFHATRISMYELLQTTDVDYDIENHGHSEEFKSLIREYTSNEYFRKLDVTREEPHTIMTMINKTMTWVIDYTNKHSDHLFIIEAKVFDNYPNYNIINLLVNYPCVIPSDKMLVSADKDIMLQLQSIRKFVQKEKGITTSMLTSTK